MDFISDSDLRAHVAATIEKYGEKLQPIDTRRLNKNLIDPIKLIFDKTVYRSTWNEIINSEIFRQRDKANNNDIGYFHQRIFKYIYGCEVPDNGTQGGWDVIYRNSDGIVLPEGDLVHTVYVEMKNKHNTMNSASAGKTYIKMQNQLLNDDDCACFLVEAIAAKSQNVKWETTVDGNKVSHRRIRRVSLDQFYAITTARDDAFYALCCELPGVIQSVVEDGEAVEAPNDTALTEIRNIARTLNLEPEDFSMAMAVYLLGYSTYLGFKDYFDNENSADNIKTLYEIAKG